MNQLSRSVACLHSSPSTEAFAAEDAPLQPEALSQQGHVEVQTSQAKVYRNIEAVKTAERIAKALHSKLTTHRLSVATSSEHLPEIMKPGRPVLNQHQLLKISSLV